MVRAIILAFCVIGFALHAETQGSSTNDPFAQRKILGIDPDYLTSKPAEQPADPSQSKSSNRYLDSSSDDEYNTEQRARWIKECEEARKEGSEAFKKCFEQKKTAELKAVREKFDEVERNQSNPMRSAPNPLLDDVRRGPKDEN